MGAVKSAFMDIEELYEAAAEMTLEEFQDHVWASEWKTPTEVRVAAARIPLADVAEIEDANRRRLAAGGAAA